MTGDIRKLVFRQGRGEGLGVGVARGLINCDLLLQLACASTVELDEVLDQIGNLTGVRSSESLVHLSTKFDRAV